MTDAGTNGTAWDSLFLRYVPEDRNAAVVELPCRVLVIGDCGASGTSVLADTGTRLTHDNIDEVLGHAQVQVRVIVSNLLAGEASVPDRLAFEVPVRRRIDFMASRVIENEPILQAWQQWLVQLDAGGSLESGMPEMLTPVLGSALADLSREWQRLEADAGVDVARDVMLARLRDRLIRQVEAIRSAPEWCRVESVWTGVNWLLGFAGDVPGASVDLWHFPPEALRDDVPDEHAVTESRLYERLHEQELGQFGGQPFTAVLIDDAFTLSEPDVNWLRALATVGARVHAPVILRPHAGVFAAEDDGGIADGLALKSEDDPVLDEGAAARHAALAAMPESRYLVSVLPDLVFPRMTAHLVEHDASICLHPGHALLARVMRSFARHGVAVDIAGPSGGNVTGIPPSYIPFRTWPVPPLTAVFPAPAAQRLVGFGIIPLVPQVMSNSIMITTPVTARQASGAGDGGTQDDAGLLLSHTFLVARVIHYLRVIQRDFIGSTTNPAEMERELKAWLREYVADTDNPAPALRGRRPLRKADVRIERIDDPAQHAYRMVVEIAPHLRNRREAPLISADTQL